MIYLHTGQPGAGKTLLTLYLVRDRAKREGRTVYYTGIEILRPDEFPGWEPLEDPQKWFELPDGAIIVHDECQTLYRPRGNGAAVPDYVARFETHRHQGYDIYLITQHPMLVDSNIRRLAGEHAHVVRAFGAKLATVHRWAQVKEQCDKVRSDSVSTAMSYPKELFGAYRSATVHTHKMRLPGRIWMLPLVPIMIGVCVLGFMQWYGGVADGQHIAQSLDAQGLTTGVTQTVSGASGAGRQQARAQTIGEWMAERQPRVQGLPHTAPLYDKVTDVVRAPYPAACVASATRCLCYTQQGTRMQVPEDMCRQIAETGYFVAWDTSERREGQGDQRRVSDGGRPEPERYALIKDGGMYGGIPPLR